MIPRMLGLGVLSMLVWAGCGTARAPGVADPVVASSPASMKAPLTLSAPMRALLGQMTGSFSSAKQAADDSDYFDIRLEMVPIWTERADGPWIYVEQAAASALEKPYRQRVYRLEAQEGGQFASHVYTLPGEALDFAGAWRTPGRFDAVTPEQLAPRQGCAVILRAVADGSFAGSTVDKACVSTLRGAAYATSEVTVSGDAILSWDRGYDAQDQQVWGAEKGPYTFLRVQAP